MNIHLKQTKFHKVCFKKYYVNKINKEELTLRTLLCYYQDLACQKYYNEALHSKILGFNYDARFNVNLKQVGLYNIIEYTLTAVDPLYINDDNYTIEGLEELFNELIIPRFWNKKCVNNLLKVAKEVYASDLLSRFENPQILAFENTIKNYFKGTIRDYDTYGSFDELNKINSKDLYNYYQKIINEPSISISSGNFERENNEVFNLTPKTDFQFKFRGNHDDYLFEEFNSSQCYLQIVYETNTYSDDPKGMAMRGINYLLGGKQSSYLFNLVREKHGLCYSINSMYLGASGIIIVSTIIDYENIDKVIKLVDEALNEIALGKFDIEEVKENFTLNFNTQKDNFHSIIENYLMDNYFSIYETSNMELSKISNLTKKDILESLSQIKRTFVYGFGGKND